MRYGRLRSFAAVVPEARAVGRLGMRLLAARVKLPGVPARLMPA